MSRRLSICFVSPQALPALLETGPASCARDGVGGIGGAELQQALVGRELARRGHRITFLIADPDGHEGGVSVPENLGGVRVIAYPDGRAPAPGTPAAAAGGRGWRLAREAGWLVRAMLRAESDVYTVRSNHLCAAMASGICRMLGKPFVFASGHDGNCDPDRAHRPLHPVVALSYAAALRNATAVVAQGLGQRELLERHFGVKARMIPSAIGRVAAPPAARREGVLWVGCIEPRKGPDLALDTAEAAPGIQFTMVGGPGDCAGWHDEVRARAERLRNVRWLGPQPRSRTLELFGDAALYLNTSRSEGFPNTFLEAWMHGTPVVSLAIDPDGCLAREGIGLVTGGIGETVRAILGMIGEPRRREAMARAARLFVEARHGIDSVVDAWENLLREAALTGGARDAVAAAAGVS